MWQIEVKHSYICHDVDICFQAHLGNLRSPEVPLRECPRHSEAGPRLEDQEVHDRPHRSHLDHHHLGPRDLQVSRYSIQYRNDCELILCLYTCFIEI